MSINTTFLIFQDGGLLRILNVRNISCWSGVLFTIMCVRTQKFLSYASSAIFRTCYSLSVCKIFNSRKRSRASNCVTVPNLVKIARTAAEIWRFFLAFSIWRPPPSWSFEISRVRTVKRVELHQHAKFRQIGQTAAEIWLFLYFSRWRPPPSCIFEISNF